jgi:hypothetical protein
VRGRRGGARCGVAGAARGRRSGRRGRRSSRRLWVFARRGRAAPPAGGVGGGARRFVTLPAQPFRERPRGRLCAGRRTSSRQRGGLVLAPLVSSAERRVDLAPPSGAALRWLLRQFACGPVPRDLGRCPARRSPSTRYCPPSAPAREVLANFGRTVVHTSMASPRDDTPSLDALPGFSGEARAWNEALVESFSLYRAGRVPWTARRQSARGDIAASVFC